MIQEIIKKVLRKWLKKKLYSNYQTLTANIARFNWVYNSPLREWRNRIWVVNQHSAGIAGIEFLDKVIKEYF